MSTVLSEKDAIVASLKCGNGVNSFGDLLACYPTHDGWYNVDYVYSEESASKLNLTEREKRIVKDEEELAEIFESPEEAADFYIRLRNGNNILLEKPQEKRTLTEKVQVTVKEVKQNLKDAFFS